MTKEEQLGNLLDMLYSTTTYDWMLDNPDLFVWNEDNTIVLMLDNDLVEIPDYIKKDIEIWNREIEDLNQIN